ncbi:MAG: esterase/lipase family protein [Christensenellales bacterium]
MKKILCIILVVSMIMLTLLCFTACDAKIDETAIIILPGLLASGLYDAETGEPVWDPFTSENVFIDMFINHGLLDISAIDGELVNNAISVVKAIVNNDPKSLSSLMAMDSNGVPIYKSLLPADENFDNPSRIYYGALGNCKQLYDALEHRYGDVAQIKVFNYDWRISNVTNAKLLEDFINKKGYKNVYFVAHSMGGQLASCYLARSESNSEKVKGLVSLDSPFYGAISALSIIEDREGMIDSLVTTLKNMNISLIDTYLKNMLDVSGKDRNAIYSKFKEVCLDRFMPMFNFDTLIELLPSKQLIDTPQYTMKWDYIGTKSVTSFIKINGEYLTDTDEIIEFYKSRHWAYTVNEDGTQGELRDVVKNLENYWENLSTSLKIDTLYVNAIGYDTQDTVCYSAPLDENGKPVYKDAVMIGTESQKQGDNTVLLYSGTCGLSADDERVMIVTNGDHFDVAFQFNYFTSNGVYNWLDKRLF